MPAPTKNDAAKLNIPKTPISTEKKEYDDTNRFHAPNASGTKHDHGRWEATSNINSNGKRASKGERGRSEPECEVKSESESEPQHKRNYSNWSKHNKSTKSQGDTPEVKPTPTQMQSSTKSQSGLQQGEHKIWDDEIEELDKPKPLVKKEIIELEETESECDQEIIAVPSSKTSKNKKKNKKDKRKCTSGSDSSESDTGVGKLKFKGEKMITTYLRKTILRLGGWYDMYQIQEPLDDGTYWVENTSGTKLLRPNWDQSFEINWRAWGNDFIDTCRDYTGADRPTVKALKSVSDSYLRDKLKAAQWKSFMHVWRSTKKGDQVGSREEKNRRNAKNIRIAKKLGDRNKAREKTTLASKTLDFVFHRGFTSREVSDAENEHQLSIEDPNYRSEHVRDILNILTNKRQSEHPPRPNVGGKTRTYRKVDAPLPNLGNGLRIQRWAIDDDWYEKHKDEIEEKPYLVDMEATQPPDLQALRSRYGGMRREYANNYELRSNPASPPASVSSNNCVEVTIKKVEGMDD